MIKYKEPLTQEDKDYLDPGVIEALRLKMKEKRDMRALKIVDKIDWSNDIITLRVLYYEMYNSFGEYYSEDKEMVRQRLVAILDEPFDAYLKKMDITTGYARKNY